jgi:hypothetical protein
VDRRSGHSLHTTEKSAFHTIGVGRVVERSEEGKAHGVQRPVYFVGKVLSPTKQRYPHYQKLAYSVFTIA